MSLYARAGPLTARPGEITVVLVHGLVISSLYMVPTLRELGRELPVLAPDLPGFGLSPKPRHVLTIEEHADVLHEWLRPLGRVVLVGNSLGCQFIAELARRHGVALMAGAVLAGPTMDRHARTARQQIGRWLVDWTRERPSLALAHARDYAQAGLRRALKTFRYALAHRIEDALPSLNVPALVVRGSRDAIVPQAWAEEVVSLLPQGRLHVIDGGPHCVNYTTPAAFAGVVRRFVAELS